MANGSDEGYSLEPFFHAALESVGISCERIDFLRWHIADDRPIPRLVRTFEDLMGLNDGRYHLSLTEVTVEGLEAEDEDTEIDTLDIELTLENGEWIEFRVHPGEETFFGKAGDKPEDLSRTLGERFDKLLKRLSSILGLIKQLKDIAQYLN